MIGPKVQVQRRSRTRTGFRLVVCGGFFRGTAPVRKSSSGLELRGRTEGRVGGERRQLRHQASPVVVLVQKRLALQDAAVCGAAELLQSLC